MPTLTTRLTDTTSGKEPSLWAQYYAEREGRETLEVPGGFTTYSFPDDDTCYIIDMFVERSQRRSGLAWDMAEQISQQARDRGCKVLYTSVDPNASGTRQSLLAILSYGFELSHIAEPLIFLKKEL